ncbi:MAG: hypothetical protein M3Y27_22720, partial [Acidobacteriota bacterium]|nr:hypothetical protein [Acidobacteriota bacterium]
MTTPDFLYDPVRAKTAELIRDKLFHPYKESDEIVRMSEEFGDLWPTWSKGGNLEDGVNAWLQRLNLSHTGFWRGPGSGLPPYFAINAILKRLDDGRLMFWDVLPGGITERCGIAPGDVLLGIEGQEVERGEPRFRLGATYSLTVSREGVEKTFTVSLPGTGPKDRPPMVEPKPLTFWTRDRIAVLKVTSFPG